MSEIDNGSGACIGDYIGQKGWNLNFISLYTEKEVVYHQHIILPSFGMSVPSFFVMDQETAGFVEP
jgi:hypothetical protein